MSTCSLNTASFLTARREPVLYCCKNKLSLLLSGASHGMGLNLFYFLNHQDLEAWGTFYLYLHPEKLDALFGTVIRKDWRNWEKINKQLVYSRDMSSIWSPCPLEVHRTLLWGGRRQSSLCSHLLKPLGNLSSKKPPGALLNFSSKLFVLLPNQAWARKAWLWEAKLPVPNWGAPLVFCCILLDGEYLENMLLETSWCWGAAWGFRGHKSKCCRECGGW